MMASSSTVGAGAVVLILVYYIGRSVYRLYLHPLAKYPGPRLAAISEFWYARMVLGGLWPWIMHEAHAKYGPIVRIAPNDLSFATVQAAKDVYGPPSKTRKLFPKHIGFYDSHPAPPASAFMIDPEAHAVRRGLLQPGFRTQALRDQEALLHDHTDALLDNLAMWMESSADGGIDVTEVWQWLTFDIIAQLVFGESFGAVKDGQSHFWVSILLEAQHTAIIQALRHRLPFVDLLIKALPWVSRDARDMLRSLEQHRLLTQDKVRKRVAMGDSVAVDDLIQGLLDDGSMSEDELSSEMMLVLVAGAETSATTLTAATWFLATNPSALQALQTEIRSSFPTYSAITGDAVAALPYLNAVIEETLRLFPAVPIGLPRVSPGETVDGEYVGAGTGVSVPMWTIHRHPELVPNADEFDPGRWLVETAPSKGEEGEEGGGETMKEKKQSKKPYTFPFILGPRSCIGINLAYLEMRIALAKLVYRYDFELLPGEWEATEPGADWPSQCRVTTLWKKVPLRVKFGPVSGAATE